MVKKQNKPKQHSAAMLKSNTKKGTTLSAMDIVVAVLFVGSLIFCIAAFANSTHPLKDSFVVWPLLIGAAIGLLAGGIVWKVTHFESLPFLLIVLALTLAALSVGGVLCFNRPLDKAPGRVELRQVAYKLPRENPDANTPFVLEMKDFSIKRVNVEAVVYNNIQVGGNLEVVIRPGYFGYEYLEKIRLPGAAVPVP